MRWKTLVSIVLWLSAAPAEAADFRLAYGDWRYDLAGAVTDRGEHYDFEDDLGLAASGRGSLRLEFDTASGWPDLAAGYSRLGARGRREERTVGAIGPIVLPGTTRTIVSSADFDDYDLTARVPLDWSQDRLSLGLTLKRLRGQIFIDDSEQTEPTRQRYDEVFPQLHASLRLPLGKLLTLRAVAQGIEYRGSRASEFRATAELRVLKRLLLEGGWQQKRYEINLDAYRLDATLDGLLLRAGLLFG